jgi:hypothetical protein
MRLRSSFHLIELSFADAANNHHSKRARWRRLWQQQIKGLLNRFHPKFAHLANSSKSQLRAAARQRSG